MPFTVPRWGTRWQVVGVHWRLDSRCQNRGAAWLHTLVSAHSVRYAFRPWQIAWVW